MRLAALGLGAPNLTAVLITHLHSDHITDLNDVITTRWVMTFVPTPLTIVGPVGTRAVVDHILASLEPDIGYRIAHHDDLEEPPQVDVIEVTDGLDRPARWRVDPLVRSPTTSRSNRASGSASITTVWRSWPPATPSRAPGSTRLCAGADALVHTVIRKDIIAGLPMQRIKDTLDYHSSPEEAAPTAARGGRSFLFDGGTSESRTSAPRSAVLTDFHTVPSGRIQVATRSGVIVSVQPPSCTR